MAFLKSLPISAFALAAGQIIPTVLLLSAWELIGLAIVAIALGPIDPALLIGIVLALVPLNAVLVALDNVLFLLMPYRIVAKDPGQMPFMGRLLIVLFLKLFLLVILAGLAAIPATIVWQASGRFVLATALAVVAFLLGCALPMTFGVAAAFKAFDVSRDVPD